MDTDRIKCTFRHNGPREFRLALVPSKCPSCNCSYYHDTKDYPDTKEKLTAYRASVLRHLGLCRGLACAREFWEYVVAVQEPGIGFPGPALLVAFFLSYTHTYSCKGCNALELPREIERVISVMKDAMVKRPSNSFADFPTTVQCIQQRLTAGSSQVDQTQCDAGMCHGSQPSPHLPEQETQTPVGKTRRPMVRNKTLEMQKAPSAGFQPGACTPDACTPSRDAFKTKINLVTALTLEAPNEVSRDGMGKELEVVKQELSATKLNNAALLNALQKALLDNERLEKELSGLKEDSSCIVCMEKPRRMAALPCKHHLLCTECAEILTTHPCPMCKGHVSEYFRTVKN